MVLVGSWIAPYSSVSLSVQFQPLAEGTIRDTLRIVSRLSGPDTLLVPLTATVPSIPAVPESLVIRRGAVNNINLYWAPVTHSICGNPLTILQYHIFASTNPDGPFNQIGISAIDSFVHPFIINAQPIYFYRVTAEAPAPAGMVYVPAGPYQMGADYNSPYSLPIHTVNVPAFYMDISEVTNIRYKAFCDATSRAYPSDAGFSNMPNYFTDPAYANYPVVNVDWYDAGAYATWAGKRLPTEAEWERAAKGNTDNRQYPWGDIWVETNANIGGMADGYPNTSPVGTYPNGISPVGCYDMVGNMYEWCEDDWHSSYNGAPTNGSAWIDYPHGSNRVLRGGSWFGSGTSARCAYRGTFNPTIRYNFVGFRFAKTP
jgi:formylglycine-generating enzyme required for sulfatase activity